MRVHAGHIVALLLTCQAIAGAAEGKAAFRPTLGMAVVHTSVTICVVWIRELLRARAVRDTFEDERQCTRITTRCARPQVVTPKALQILRSFRADPQSNTRIAGIWLVLPTYRPRNLQTLNASVSHSVVRIKGKLLAVRFQEGYLTIRDPQCLFDIQGDHLTISNLPETVLQVPAHPERVWAKTWSLQATELVDIVAPLPRGRNKPRRSLVIGALISSTSWIPCHEREVKWIVWRSAQRMSSTSTLCHMNVACPEVASVLR